MNILLVSSGFPNFTSLNGIFEYDQAKALAKLGHKIIFVGIDLHSFRKKRRWGIQRDEKKSIIIYTVDIPIGNIPLFFLVRIVSFLLKQVYSKIKKEFGKVDLVHAHFGMLYGYGTMKLCNREHLRYFITEHSSLVHQEYLSTYRKKLLRTVYASAQKVIAVSSALQSKIYTHTHVNSVVIPNIVSISEFSYSPIAHRSFKFVSVGNLITIKRMSLLVRLFSECFKEKPNVSLTIFGDGPDYNNIQSIINKNRMQNQIFLMGKKKRYEIAEFYKIADCFVLLSSSETFGVAYVEAMASGLPVIATKCGGPNDFINEENGILIDQINNENLIKDALLKMLYKKFDNKLISENVLKRFSPDCIANQIVDIYNEYL